MKRFYILFALILSFLYAQQGQFRSLDIQTSYNASDEQIAQLLSRTFSLAQDFELIRDVERESPIARYVAFHQSYQGVPIHHAGIKVCINKDGAMQWAMDFLQRDIQTPATDARWKVSEQAIRFRLLKQFSTLDVQLAKAWFLPKDSKSLVPVWRAWTFSHNQDESYEVIIHAETGVELERTDRAMYHKHSNKQSSIQTFEQSSIVSPSRAEDIQVIRNSVVQLADTPGTGRVWTPNPITASGSSYGTIMSDNGDMHNQVFESYIDTVVLKDLTYDNGTFKLEGPHVRIVDLSANFNTPVTSSNGEFFYTRDQTGWEDVMVYYHIDTFQRYIQSLGFMNLWGDKPLQADPHGRGNNDNSSFIPNGDNSSVGFGEGGVDDAEDADVIIHEYGHALSYAGSPNTNTGFERRGLDEGFGDYFAAAFSYDQNNGGFGWGDVMNWDGHNPFWPGREADNTAFYQQNPGSFYTHGELWASAMMDARQTIGAAKVDQMQFEILYSLSPNMTLPDAARLVIAADWMYNNGVHEAALRQIFCSRRILTGNDCLLTSTEPDVDAFSWVSTSNQSNVGIQWQGLQPRNWEARIIDVQGRVVGKIDNNTPELHGISSGVYVVSMQISNKVAGSRKQVVL